MRHGLLRPATGIPSVDFNQHPGRAKIHHVSDKQWILQIDFFDFAPKSNTVLWQSFSLLHIGLVVDRYV